VSYSVLKEPGNWRIKIVSGGQTGADRAALDWAIKVTSNTAVTLKFASCEKRSPGQSLRGRKFLTETLPVSRAGMPSSRCLS
jgi:hypothetical protein